MTNPKPKTGAVKIALYLMNRKGVRCLETFLENWGTEPIACVVGGEAPGVADRSFEDIARLCGQHGIAHHRRGQQPEISAAHSIAIGWRWMLDPRGDTLVTIHDSLLPRYRGFAPLVNQLINGEKFVGATAFVASASYDRGKVLAQRKAPVKYPIKIAAATEVMGGLYSELLEELVPKMLSGKLGEGKPQIEKNATYSLWRDEEDYALDWSLEASRLVRTIHALGAPYAGASSYLGTRKVRILDAVALKELRIENRTPGKVIFNEAGLPVVVCGRGLLKITEARFDGTMDSVLPMKEIRARFRTEPPW
jgi:methionyl-tRNA formyltransferase